MRIKNVLIILFGFAILAIAPGCKKSSTATTPYKCATCNATPQALAANNIISKGIYKGVVIGSTGTIIFDVLNNGTTITAVMVIDGVSVNLVSNVTWTAGQPYNAPFTGTFNGSPISITFSVGVTGNVPTVTASNIPGHPNMSFTVAKELSTSMIECFEGVYHTTRPEDGTFNIILSRTAGQYGAAGRANGGTSTSPSSGTVLSDNTLKDSNGTIIGTLAGDGITGTFSDGGGNTVTITGHRTL